MQQHDVMNFQGLFILFEFSNFLRLLSLIEEGLHTGKEEALL